MNPLVQELAKQAQYDSLYEKYYLQETRKREITPTEYQNIYNQKFAELIIRECARVSATIAGTFDEGSFVAKRIKEHFGVKE